jgi:MSHA biogenesis protein MshL
LNGNLSFVQQGDYSPQSGFSTQVLRINAGNAKNFNPIITALANQGHVSVLSSPRVSILNNQRGIIKFGSDGYYLTNISSNVQSGATAGTNVVNSSLGLTPIFSGLALDATASIINDREVILHIHPTITRVTEEEKTLTLNQQRTVLPLALIQSREADTIVKANSGDIIVIGGLMQNSVEMDRSNFNTKNSFLNKLLKAFGNKQDYNLKSELVILLRPVIDDMGIGIEALDKHLIEDKLD